MPEPDNNQNKNQVPGATVSGVDSDVSVQTQEFDRRIRDCQSEHGADHPALADLLDEYAAFLRRKRIRALDAANFSARARVIRGTPEADEAGDQDDNDESVEGGGDQAGLKETKGDGKTVMAICAALVVLFVASLCTLVADINMRRHSRDLELDHRARAEATYLEPVPIAAGNYSSATNRTGDLIWAGADNPGQRIDINAILQNHKKTVIFIHSENCVYSSQMLPLVERLAQARQDLFICAVNIDRSQAEGIDFDSPAAHQFDIHAVPKFRIYDERGVLVAGDDAAKAQVKRWMQECHIAR